MKIDQLFANCGRNPRPISDEIDQVRSSKGPFVTLAGALANHRLRRITVMLCIHVQNHDSIQMDYTYLLYQRELSQTPTYPILC